MENKDKNHTGGSEMPGIQPMDFGGNPSLLNGSSILITGGTGSFGRYFVRSLLENGEPERLVVFSRDELKQYEMDQDLRSSGVNMKPIRFFLGCVRDGRRLEMALNGIDTVIHAAALKQVPAAEYNPFECIHTNVLGAENVVQASIRTGVKRVVALSTDKACSPINLYGASKLASDKIFVAANNLSGSGGCKFSVVRYGNVMGSRGSVVPFFRQLADSNSDHIPITDPRMTRFWITLDQGVSFVISCLSMMGGGELFVPKIPSIKITDLAEAIAPGILPRIVGIRPGEKLHESMITEDDARNTIELSDRYILEPQTYMGSQQDHLVHRAGNRVPEEFFYTSDTNEEWLSAEDIRSWLALK